MSQFIREEVMQASQQWIANFNQGKTEACIARYLSEAHMQVSPFGRFEGVEAIAEFWQQFAKSKPGNLVYRNIDIKVLSDTQAILSANWTMNIASGFISKELWVKGSDSQWYLAEDDFSVLSQHQSSLPEAKRTALVLVDFQNDYFTNGRFELENTTAAANKAGELLSHFREKELPVIHIQHIFENSDAPFFAPDTTGADIYPDLAPKQGETLIIKHQINSFTDTHLEQHLIELGIEKLIIVGAMAQACIQSITRSAVEKGYQCEVIQDAVAAPALEHNGMPLSGEQILAANLVSLTFGMAELKTARECLAAKN